MAHPFFKSRLGGRVLTTSQVKGLRRWLAVARKRGLPHDFANNFMLGGKVKKQKGKNTKATLPLKRLSRLAVAPSLMRSAVLYSVSAARAIIGARESDEHHQQQHGNTPFIFLWFCDQLSFALVQGLALLLLTVLVELKGFVRDRPLAC